MRIPKEKARQGLSTRMTIQVWIHRPMATRTLHPYHLVQRYNSTQRIVPRFSSDYVCLTRYPPQHPGWGRNPREDFLHTVPKSHGGPDQKRAVFRSWPRRPHGKHIISTEKPLGTLSPDGYPWGATLYDFYAVHRFPDIQLAISYMTGSALLQAMKALDELDAAVPEIEWAMSEGKPRDEGVADTEELIECTENRIQMMVHCGFSMVDWSGGDEVEMTSEKEKEEKHDKEDGEDVVGQAPENDSDDNENNNDEGHEEDQEASQYDDEAKDESELDDMEIDPASIPPPPVISVTSPFHPSHYPKLWPVIPFEKPVSILLQERIPLYLLPQTLYVHDPFNLLPAREGRFRNTSWNSRPDIVRTYNLRLSASVHKHSEEARQKAEKLEEFKARTLIVLRYKRTKEQIKNYHPVVEVPLPPYPRRMTRVEESHLYLSPVAKVGEGNHSIVYKGEWELPRDLFVKPKLCVQCFKESADKEIQRLKDTGRWAKMLNAAAWGPRGRTGRLPTQAELDAVNDPTNLEQDGEIIEREITCIVPPNAPPSQILETLNERNVWDMFMKQSGVNNAVLNFASSSDEHEDKSTDSGSYVAHIRINPPFSYESQRTCTHGLNTFPIPRTTKFTVIAKLSLENDHHLAREGSNYQQFPERFFHHYDGYTIIQQLHALVPVHAIVPQFYGYYTPQKSDKREESYLSPILLLEHCGEPVDPNTLSVEDQEECVSMVLRFQNAGWLHGSLAPRNFLVQKGKPTDFPLERQVHPKLSFRLIDFGRSRKFEGAAEKRGEEMDALKMFRQLMGKMAVTFSIQ